MGNDAFFQALDVGCNAFMYLLHTWLSEKGRLIQFLFNKNHVIFFSVLFFCFFYSDFPRSSFHLDFIYSIWAFVYFLLFLFASNAKCICFTQMEGWCTNKAFAYKQQAFRRRIFFWSVFFFCFYLLLLSEKSVH